MTTLSPGNAIRWAAIVVLLALLAVPAILVSLTGSKIVEVDGRSMEPSILLGDVVVIAPPSDSDFVIGAVVTASEGSGDKYTHRIVGFADDGSLLLKGDNNKVDDPSPVPRESIVGVVKATFSGPAATFVLQLQSWPLRICVLTMIVGLVFLPMSVRATTRRSGRRSARAELDDQPASKTGTRALSERQREEALELVDSMRSSMARALLGSPRRLTGQMTVATEAQDTDGFPDLRVVIRIAEKREAPSMPTNPSRVGSAGQVPPAVVSSRRQLRTLEKTRRLVPARGPLEREAPRPVDMESLLRTPAQGSLPADLPSRREHRNAVRHGRRRAS